MNQCDVVLRNPVRTAIDTDSGRLKEVPTPEFGAAAICETLKRLRLATRPRYSMRHDGLKRGLVTPCIGGGQEIALALEII